MEICPFSWEEEGRNEISYSKPRRICGHFGDKRSCVAVRRGFSLILCRIISVIFRLSATFSYFKAYTIEKNHSLLKLSNSTDFRYQKKKKKRPHKLILLNNRKGREYLPVMVKTIDST